MFDISALYVWNCLEQAKDGKNLYGGDTAEVYAQHLAPSEPVEDQWKYAGKSLYALLVQFCDVNAVCALVDGKVIGDWMNDYSFFHKCEVRIFNNEQRIENGGGSPEEIQQNSDEHSEGVPTKIAQDKGTENILSPVFLHGQAKETFGELENAIRIRNKKR